MDRGGGQRGLIHPPDPRRPCPNPLPVRRTQSRPRSSCPTARSPSSCGSPPFLLSPPSRHAACLHPASLLPPKPLQEARPPCCKAAGPDLEEEEEIPGSRWWLGTVPFRYALHGADGFHGAEESMCAFCWKGLGGWEGSAVNDECWRSFYCDTTLSSFMRHGHSQKVKDGRTMRRWKMKQCYGRKLKENSWPPSMNGKTTDLRCLQNQQEK